MRTSNALKKLMDSGCDGERMLRHESEFVEGLPRILLRRLADERQANGEQLRGSGTSSGGGHGSWAELGRELARSVRVAAGGRNRGDAVASCRRAMGRLEEVYERAMVLAWPDETRTLLAAQLVDVRRANQELISVQY
jgi:hypothetical protein